MGGCGAGSLGLMVMNLWGRFNGGDFMGMGLREVRDLLEDRLWGNQGL